MKFPSAIAGLSLLALSVSAALPQPDLLAQIHFAGAQKISSDPHSTAFTNEFTSPEALALRAQTATKLANWLAGWLQTNVNVSVPGGAAKLRPLFDDLQSAEWFLDVRAAANGKPVVGIAIRLNPARAQLWQAGLSPFFPSATFKSVGGWLIFDSNPALLKLGDVGSRKDLRAPAGWLDSGRQLAPPGPMVSGPQNAVAAGNAIHGHRAGSEFPHQRPVSLPAKPGAEFGTLAHAHEHPASAVQ